MEKCWLSQLVQKAHNKIIAIPSTQRIRSQHLSPISKNPASASKLAWTCVELDIKICTAALANNSAPSKKTRVPIILAAATKLVSRLLFHFCWGVGVR